MHPNSNWSVVIPTETAGELLLHVAMLREQRSNDCASKSTDSRGKSLPRWSGATKTPVRSTCNSALESWTTVNFKNTRRFHNKHVGYILGRSGGLPPERAAQDPATELAKSNAQGMSYDAIVVGKCTGTVDRDRGKPHNVQQTRLSPNSCASTGVSVRGDVTTPRIFGDMMVLSSGDTHVFLHLQKMQRVPPTCFPM